MRAFIAIDISADIRRKIAALQDRISPRCPILRWTDADQIHMTLQFLGEISQAQVAPITAELRDLALAHPPMALEVAGIGAFPSPRSVRVLWTGVIDKDSRLEALQQDCARRLERLGFAPEKRPFHPHLTLARAKGDRPARDLAGLIEQHTGFTAGRWPVTELVLYESQLSQKGPKYTSIDRFRLSGTDGG